MRFVVDRCAGRRLAEWLRIQGHDVVEAQTLGPDPGDRALLEQANCENRIPVTLDKDYGELIYLHKTPHAGLIRLPDVRAPQRIILVEELLNHHRDALESKSIITVRNERIIVSNPPVD